MPTKLPKIKDELELAIDVNSQGLMNSSGLVDRGFLDEMGRNDEENSGKPSGRFQQQASIRKENENASTSAKARISV